MSGFVERVIEDWLTNADERSYQASFVSLLVRSGHRIRYVSKHSTLEFGKDIVSISPQGELTAFQLKAGNVNLSTWRKVKGEVYELADEPYRSPSGRRRRPKRCFLVTTGQIDDTVNEQLRDHNEENREKGLAEIETIDRHDLTGQFQEVFTEFFPKSLGTFNELVQIYLSNGRGPVDKELLSSVFSGLIPPESRGKRKVARALSNLVVAAEFTSTPFRLALNHISVIDIWTLAACRIRLVARRFDLEPKQWQPWLEFCQDAIDASGDSLLAEALERSDFAEGDLLADLMVLPYRKTIVLGYAAATINSRRIRGVDTAAESKELLRCALKHAPLGIWSEASWNYYLNLAVALSASPRGDLIARELIASWLSTVSSTKTLESPYTTVHSVISNMASELRAEPHRLRASYSLGSAIDFLCRRMWRQALAPLWPTVSKFELAELTAESTEDQFEWVMNDATLEVQRLPMRGSWTELRKDSFRQRSELFSDDDVWLLPYMLCTYPQRVTRKLSGELEYQAGGGQRQREWA